MGRVCIQGGLHPGGLGIPHWILRDTLNERAVHILLECFSCLAFTVSWNLYCSQKKFIKVMFLHVSVCPHRQVGMCGWGCALQGGMYGRGHAWFAWQGGVWHACPPWRILRNTVNERVVQILLECILVEYKFF